MTSTNLSPGLQVRKQVASMATVALLGISYFVVVIVALHVLRPDLSPISQPTSQLALLTVWGVAVLIAMIFPLNAVGAPETVSSMIHRVSGPLAFLSLTVGVILVSRRFKQDETWRPIRRFALTLSWVMVAAFAGTFLSLGIFPESGIGGLCQRILLATFVVWFLLTAAHLRSLARVPAPA